MPSTRLGAFTTTYNELDWLDVIAPQLAMFDHSVVVLSTTPMNWYYPKSPNDHSTPPPKPDVARVRTLCKLYGIDLIIGEFSRSDDAWYRGEKAGISAMARQRKAGINALLDCDAAAWFAPDEVYSLRDVNMLIATMRSDPTQMYTPARTHILWWNECFELPPGSYWDPLVGVPIDFDPYKYDMGITTDAAARIMQPALDVTCWHFAFARSDKEMREKYLSWGHAHETHSFDHWKNWDEWKPGGINHWPPSNPVIPVTEPLPHDVRLRMRNLLVGMRCFGRP